jgi:hypothetical protein
LKMARRLLAAREPSIRGTKLAAVRAGAGMQAGQVNPVEEGDGHLLPQMLPRQRDC